MELGDLAIFHHHGETLAAGPQAEPGAVQLQAQGGGVLAVAVGQHQHLVAGAGALAPGVHHKGVVDRHAGNGIDALGLDGVGIVDETGQVFFRTGGGERPRHGKDDDFLAVEQLGAAQDTGAVRLHYMKPPRRGLVANLHCHCEPPDLWLCSLTL